MFLPHQDLRERLDNYSSDQADIQSSYSDMQKEMSEITCKNEVEYRKQDVVFWINNFRIC